MSTQFGYSEKIIELFKNPKNTGEIKDANAISTEGSVVCGDMITIYLKIDDASHVILDAKFQSYGCAANIATTSIVTEMIKGKTIEEAKRVTFKDVTKALGGLPKVKMHCAVLSVDGVRAAIRNYEERHGLVKTPEIDESFVRSRLRHVIHPTVGRDIVSTGMVKEIKIEGEKIEIELALFKDDAFQEHVIGEIHEKLKIGNKEVKIIE